MKTSYIIAIFVLILFMLAIVARFAYQSAQQINKDTAAKVQAQERTDGYVSSSTEPVVGCSLEINQDMTSASSTEIFLTLEKDCTSPIFVNANGHRLDLPVTKD